MKLLWQVTNDDHDPGQCFFSLVIKDSAWGHFMVHSGRLKLIQQNLFRMIVRMWPWRRWQWGHRRLGDDLDFKRNLVSPRKTHRNQTVSVLIESNTLKRRKIHFWWCKRWSVGWDEMDVRNRREKLAVTQIQRRRNDHLVLFICKALLLTSSHLFSHNKIVHDQVTN